MGQRHQLFVIAKINGRYRSLAALHHQWLYGISAVRRCKEVIALFQEPANRHLLELEMENARKVPDEAWSQRLDWDDTDPRFPFISTCLLIGASLDIDTGYTANVVMEPWNLAFDEGNNDDGVTILDITQPWAVRYCFVFYSHPYGFHGEDFEEDFEVTQEDLEAAGRIPMTPLSAQEYLRPYRIRNENMSDENILDEYPLISLDILAETWPRKDEWCTRVEMGLSDLPASIGAAESNNRERFSLMGLSANQVIEDALTQGIDALLVADELPLFRGQLETYLHANSNVVTEKSFGFAVLECAVKGTGELDLRPWPALTGTQIGQLVRSANRYGHLDLLELSGNQQFASADLLEIMESTTITALYLWDNPNVPASVAVPFIVSGRLTKLLHPTLFKEFNREINAVYSHHRQLRKAAESAPVFDNPVNNIKQLVWLRASPGLPDSRTFTSDTLSFAAEVRDRIAADVIDEETFEAAVIPLQDVLFGASRLIRCLSSLIAFLSSALHRMPMGLWAYSETLLGVCKTIALVGKEVYPIPPTAYGLAKTAYHSSEKYPARMQPLKRDEWTILVVQNAPYDPSLEKKAFPAGTTLSFHYVFVSEDESGKKIFLDLEEFLTRVFHADTGEQLKSRMAVWERAIGQIKSREKPITVARCDDEMAGDILALMDVLADKEKDYQWSVARH